MEKSDLRSFSTQTFIMNETSRMFRSEDFGKSERIFLPGSMKSIESAFLCIAWESDGGGGSKVVETRASNVEAAVP